jgi:hypothetical protein
VLPNRGRLETRTERVGYRYFFGGGRVAMRNSTEARRLTRADDSGARGIATALMHRESDSGAEEAKWWESPWNPELGSYVVDMPLPHSGKDDRCAQALPSRRANRGGGSSRRHREAGRSPQ